MLCIASLQKQCEALEGCCRDYQLAVACFCKVTSGKTLLVLNELLPELTLGWCPLWTWVFVTKAGCLAWPWCVCGFEVPYATTGRWQSTIVIPADTIMCMPPYEGQWWDGTCFVWKSCDGTAGRPPGGVADSLAWLGSEAVWTIQIGMLVQPQSEMPSRMVEDH